MSGLMRTTSRSESENHFFGQITNTRLSFVEFVSHYDTAMDSQRFIYGKNNHDSMYTTPDLKTNLLVENEVAELYTMTLFYDVQEEIYSSLMNCYAFELKYEVNHVLFEGKINCSWLRYECYGLLYRHIFYVLRLSKVHNFPKSYLQKRWSKNAMPHKSVCRTVEVKSSPNAVTDSDSLIRDITNHMYASLLGVTEPEEVTIHLPNGIRNKGTGHDKRYVSKSEIASTQSNKPKRLCRNCGKYIHHDSRNCPDKKSLKITKMCP
nr:hypothetical protein [Tanacetum cinerariifolium]